MNDYTKSWFSVFFFALLNKKFLIASETRPGQLVETFFFKFLTNYIIHLCIEPCFRQSEKYLFLYMSFCFLVVEGNGCPLDGAQSKSSRDKSGRKRKMSFTYEL